MISVYFELIRGAVDVIAWLDRQQLFVPRQLHVLPRIELCRRSPAVLREQ